MLAYREELKISSNDSLFLYLEPSIVILEKKNSIYEQTTQNLLPTHPPDQINKEQNKQVTVDFFCFILPLGFEHGNLKDI